MIRSSAQGISPGILGPLPIIDPEVKLGKEFGPSGLSSVKGFGCSEISQVLVVRVDLTLVSSATKVGSPFLKSLYDGEELFVVDGVVHLSVVELLREERYCMKLPVIIPLSQLASYGKVGCIGLDSKGFAGSGSLRTGSLTMASLSRRKASSCSGPQ